MTEPLSMVDRPAVGNAPARSPRFPKYGFECRSDLWKWPTRPVRPTDHVRKQMRAGQTSQSETAFEDVLRTGMPWRDLPERYGPYTTAYTDSLSA